MWNKQNITDDDEHDDDDDDDDDDEEEDDFDCITPKVAATFDMKVALLMILQGAEIPYSIHPNSSLGTLPICYPKLSTELVKPFNLLLYDVSF